MTDRYAVMGDPIAHSKSPFIHARFAAQTGQDMEYCSIRVPLRNFENAVENFRLGGGKGLNLTVPLKQEAWALSAHRGAMAERAGAVNTIWFGDDGSVHGENTDGIGLVRDLTRNHKISIDAKQVLLLGAGGAARGVLGPLLEQRPAVLVIANRTHSRAEELVRAFGPDKRLKARRFDDLARFRFDLVINATAASLVAETPPISPTVLAPEAACYDMMYANEPTAFVRWAREGGVARAFDGVGMLVEQAAESFYLWRGRRPLTRPVLEALRAEFAATKTSAHTDR